MKRYIWDKRDGLLDADTGQQVLQLVANYCTNKFRNMAGKELAEKLNSIERDNSYST